MTILSYLQDSYNYLVCILLMMTGFYIVIISNNLIKKIMGLAIFQTSVLLFYISMSYVFDAREPIIEKGYALYINPLPHVLMLTAIVVGVATLSVGLAIIVRIKEAYGTVEEDQILEIEHKEQGGISRRNELNHNSSSTTDEVHT